MAAFLECGGRVSRVSAKRRRRFSRFRMRVGFRLPSKAVSPVAVAPSATALQSGALGERAPPGVLSGYAPGLEQAGGLSDFSRWLSEAWRATPPE